MSENNLTRHDGQCCFCGKKLARKMVGRKVRYREPKALFLRRVFCDRICWQSSMRDGRPLNKCKDCGISEPTFKARCAGCNRKVAAYRRRKNPGRYRAYRIYSLRKLKAEVIAAYGGACDCCREVRLEFLAIDHIEKGGHAHRMRTVGTGSRQAASSGFYRVLRSRGFPDRGILRVLCHNCNWSIGCYGYCPHDKPRDFDFLCRDSIELHPKMKPPRYGQASRDRRKTTA